MCIKTYTYWQVFMHNRLQVSSPLTTKGTSAPLPETWPVISRVIQFYSTRSTEIIRSCVRRLVQEKFPGGLYTMYLSLMG